MKLKLRADPYIHTYSYSRGNIEVIEYLVYPQHNVVLQNQCDLAKIFFHRTQGN